MSLQRQLPGTFWQTPLVGVVPGRDPASSLRERFEKEQQELPRAPGAGVTLGGQRAPLLQTLEAPTRPEQQQSWDLK